MANIIINDIFDELREENNRLFNEIQEISELLNKYRNFSLDLQNICICFQKSNNDSLIQSLEDEYQRIANHLIKREPLILNTSEDSFISNERPYNEYNNEDMDESNQLQIPRIDSGTHMKTKNNFNIIVSELNGMTETNERKEENSCHKELTFRSRNDECNNEDMDKSNGLQIDSGTHKKCNKNGKIEFCLYCKKDVSRVLRKYKRRNITGQWYHNKCLASYRRSHPKSITETVIKKLVKIEDKPEDNPLNVLNLRSNSIIITENWSEKIPKQRISKPKTLTKNSRKRNESNDPNYEMSDESDNYLSDVSVDKSKIKRDRRASGDPIIKRHICYYEGCARKFRYPSSLEVHIRRAHTLEKPFQCNECHKCFVDKISLGSHQKTHSLHKQFHCKECNKWFSHKQGFDKHQEILHSTQTVVYTCEECPFKTNYKGGLTKHIKYLHKMDFQKIEAKCDVEGCDRTFSCERSLRVHKMYYHSSKRFTCDWPGCGQVFSQKYKYVDHNRGHLGVRGLKCPFEGCGKTFVMAKTLSKHKQYHIKRHVCSWPECGQRFALKHLLTVHLNRHQNIRPFKCDFNGCDRDFFIKHNLNLHIRSVHT